MGKPTPVRGRHPLATLRLRSVPPRNTSQPTTPHAATVAVIGTAVPLWKSPTSAPAPAPREYWIVPMRAEALPAALSKGAIASAVRLGYRRPAVVRQAK